MLLGPLARVIARLRRPGPWSLALLIAFGCSNSDSSSGCGSSSTERCDINADSTTCGDRITLECFDGATPEAESQCEQALVDDDEALYCCVNAAGEADADVDADVDAVVSVPGGGGGGGS